jgi:dual specificity tyrosine-phosphorylation-regulated kinase 2/3/4
VRNAPISPVLALSKYSIFLTAHEKSEILTYPEIFYLGVPAAKVTSGPFDLPTHHYRANPRDHIAYRYEICTSFGRGAFGQVLKCYDHKTRETVALKMVIATRQIHRQALCEMQFVQSLNAEDAEGRSHIIKLLDTFQFRGHVCAVFEPLGPNLYEYSKWTNFKAPPLSDVRRIARQLLRALAFSHSHGVVHCDIKPENILLVPNARPVSVRVIDFGSACRIGQPHFSYIQSRFYRAPEVILGLPYGPPMDVFSFACVVAELLAGRPLFPGDSESTQLHLHMQLMGVPPPAVVAAAPRSGLFFQPDGAPRIPIGSRRSLAGAARTDNARLLDLLAKCLVWDQTQRITAEEALAHPFFAAEEAVESPRRAPAVAKAAVKKSCSADAHVQLKKKGADRAISPRRGYPWRG